MKKVFSTVALSLVIVSCNDAPDMTPHIIDVDLQECREYEIIDKKNMVIKKKKDWPIDHCNGFFAIPQDQARAWKEYYLKKREDDKCLKNQSLPETFLK